MRSLGQGQLPRAGGLLFWKLLGFFTVPSDAVRLHLSSLGGAEISVLVVDVASGSCMTFTREVERGTGIVVDDTVFVGGDTLVDVCHSPSR